MKVIGFTNKFYTLWDVQEETIDLHNGQKMHIVHNAYIKNISFDKEKAFAAYPDAPFSEELRGHSSSFNTEKIVWDNVDRFRFGKYQYMNIDNCSDTQYITWYWDNIYAEHKDHVSEVLKSRGYEIRTRTWESYDGTTKSEEYLMSPEALAIEKAEAEKRNADEKLLKAGTALSFICEYNLNENGEVCHGDFTYKFPEIKEMEYRGWPYWLPMKNGKSKRIKNKWITVNKYTYEKTDYGFTINVIDFEISK